LKKRTLVVSGSRTITDENRVKDLLNRYRFERFHTLLHGGARGVDQIAADWGHLWGLEIVEVPADWNRHGKAAGPIRNREMADRADALIAIWDGKSRGTKQMIEYFKTLKKPYIVEIVDESDTK